MRAALLFPTLALSAVACVTYGEELNRGQRHFQNNEYEPALATLRGLEGDVDSLPLPDRARYAYLRGMTDYRMSLRDDARHWLALARAYDESSHGLEEAWRDRMRDALKDLDNDVVPSSVSVSAPPGPTVEAGFD